MPLGALSIEAGVQDDTVPLGTRDGGGAHAGDGTALAPAPGWFGKIATRGDFAHRRLPPAVVAACDTWLSRVMRDGPSHLGERWWPTYLTAPVLRFAWGPGVVDAHAWLGVLMPSCDDVGRYFPLLVARPRPDAARGQPGASGLARWFEHVSEAATGTLQGGSLDDFEAALHEAPPWTKAPSPSPQDAPPAGVPEPGSGCTVWWHASAPAAEAPGLAAFDGLPDGGRFAALLAAAVTPADPARPPESATPTDRPPTAPPR